MAAYPGMPDDVRGGRLVAATEGMRDQVVNGQIVNIDGPTMLKSGAVRLAPIVSSYWGSVLLNNEPPEHPERDF